MKSNPEDYAPIISLTRPAISIWRISRRILHPFLYRLAKAERHTYRSNGLFKFWLWQKARLCESLELRHI